MLYDKCHIRLTLHARGAHIDFRNLDANLLFHPHPPLPSQAGLCPSLISKIHLSVNLSACNGCTQVRESVSSNSVSTETSAMNAVELIEELAAAHTIWGPFHKEKMKMDNHRICDPKCCPDDTQEKRETTDAAESPRKRKGARAHRSRPRKTASGEKENPSRKRTRPARYEIVWRVPLVVSPPRGQMEATENQSSVETQPCRLSTRPSSSNRS